MRINLLLLMAVSFLPLPTRLVAEGIRSEDAARDAVIFDGGTLLVISSLRAGLWAVAARDRTLLRDHVDEADIQQLREIAAPNIGFYVGATALAIVAPRAAAIVYLAIGALSVLRARGDRSQSRRAGSP
jgi:uncharacterized membrane protein